MLSRDGPPAFKPACYTLPCGLFLGGSSILSLCKPHLHKICLTKSATSAARSSASLLLAASAYTRTTSSVPEGRTKARPAWGHKTSALRGFRLAWHQMQLLSHAWCVHAPAGYLATAASIWGWRTAGVTTRVSASAVVMAFRFLTFTCPSGDHMRLAVYAMRLTHHRRIPQRERVSFNLRYSTGRMLAKQTGHLQLATGDIAVKRSPVR